MKLIRTFLPVMVLFFFVNSYAAITIPIESTADKSDIGSVIASQTKYGVLFTPNLHNLPPGIHGFHIHEFASCGDSGQGAGGHLDPKKTDKHLGPYNKEGHLGDLPALFVDSDGNATLPVLAPRLKLSELKGHALMIHQGGDNYSDAPAALGGGGPRIACGVIK